MSPSAATTFPRVLRFTLRALLVIWAAFWAWFVIAASIGEEPAPPWWIPAAWLVSLAALILLCWRWPRVGGLVLLAAGLWAWGVFDLPSTRELLAAPALALGAGTLALGWSARRVAGAALLLLGVATSGCSAPQDPADLPYETGSFLYHDNGLRQRAFLVEETVLEGLACQRWVWWREDGRLDNVELARDQRVQGHDFPAGTRIFFDREGRVAHVWLAQDTVVDGVTCAASVFHPVYLHADGHLKQCRLAADAVIAGHAHAKGETIALPGGPGSG